MQLFFEKKVGKTLVYLVLHVEDLLIIRNNESYIASIKKELNKVFQIIDLGHIHDYLGIEVTHDLEYIFISQNKYIGELLNMFGIVDCNPISNPLKQN